MAGKERGHFPGQEETDVGCPNGDGRAPLRPAFPRHGSRRRGAWGDREEAPTRTGCLRRRREVPVLPATSAPARRSPPGSRRPRAIARPGAGTRSSPPRSRPSETPASPRDPAAKGAPPRASSRSRRPPGCARRGAPAPLPSPRRTPGERPPPARAPPARSGTGSSARGNPTPPGGLRGRASPSPSSRARESGRPLRPLREFHRVPAHDALPAGIISHRLMVDCAGERTCDPSGMGCGRPRPAGGPCGRGSPASSRRPLVPSTPREHRPRRDRQTAAPRDPPLHPDQAPGPHRPPDVRPESARGGRGARGRARNPERRRDGGGRTVRPGDRPRLQRLRLLPDGVLARPPRREAAVPGSGRVHRRGGSLPASTRSRPSSS